jgi:glycerophosphoryl diester phosphodiesterase
MTLAIAHRGASRDCPENTRAAFDEALRQGADGIELDVQLSRDGVPVVYHDRTLVRAGGGRRRVARLAAAELIRLDPGARVDRRFAGQHIPTLEAVFRRYGRRTRLLVEIKTREGAAGGERHALLATTVAALVGKMKLEPHVWLLSFDAAVLQAAGRELPGVRTLLNLKPPRRMSRKLRDLDGLTGFCADVRRLTPAFADAVRQDGRPLFVYTCNTPRTVRRAAAAQPDGIISDKPGWLAATLDTLRDEA